MKTRPFVLSFVLLIAAGLGLIACGGQAAPTPDVNAAVQTALAGTRVIETTIAQSVQQTLQASAPTAAAATDTPSPAPAATNTAQPATAVPAPATNTPVPPPAATNTPAPQPQPTQPPAPTPTPTRIRIATSDVDGDDGNDFLRSSFASNNGRVILLPGFDQADVTDVPVFRDFINFRVEVFDTRAGEVDGAGIQEVTFSVVDEAGNGEVVWENQEVNPAYCVFSSDDPLCTPLDLRQTGRWPDPFGGQIRNGEYLATIDIVPDEGDATQWRWRFDVDSPYLAAAEPPALPYTARIDSIAVQDGRYIVDFETQGFVPQAGSKHVHFFFDTVPPDQAGMPGSGPWQLYPTGPGEPNTSPFTLLTVNDRPAGATQMCILVANADHSVIQNTGNCVDLP